MLALVMAGGFFAISASAEIANHVVISQVQTDSKVGSGGTSDDFLELYNPTNSVMSLAGKSLQRVNADGEVAVIAMSATGTIPSHGFYLIVRGSATTALTSLADKTFSLGIAFNNDDAFLLVNNTSTVSGLNDPDIIDLLGTGNSAWTETAAAPNVPETKALFRKSGATHLSGQGNGWDTNNNLNDFFIADPNPRNSSSPNENPPPPPPVCPTGVALTVTPGIIQTGQTASITVPAGWTGGSFASSSTTVASVAGSAVNGSVVGSAMISGLGFIAPNGATNCALEADGITVTAPPPPPPEPENLIDQLKAKLQSEWEKLSGILSGITLPQMPTLPALPNLFN